VGSVCNIVGHLGCITFDPDRRRVYGSLELKHDAIGKGIVNRTGKELAEEDAFYCVSFDCNAITSMNMDAEVVNADGKSVMTALYLPDVVQDYADTDEASGALHRYGCSGIDGTALGPVFGAPADSPKKIMICYGVYGDVSREDNDHQVILQYDPAMIDTCGKPLTQKAPHHSGCPCEARYFFYTGNTTYGVQNLEYDPFTRTYLTAVYTGKKDNFPNYPLFFIDAAKAPAEGELLGRRGEGGLLLTAVRPTPAVSENGGCWFGLGQTGVYAFGDGTYAYSVHKDRVEASGTRTFASEVVLHRLDLTDERVFVEV
ncbi:MAG: hypothetical protein IJA91_00855, partial [Clostridia bacterium]|nr:hypothetical protein [Clostridia bacterium]